MPPPAFIIAALALVGVYAYALTRREPEGAAKVGAVAPSQVYVYDTLYNLMEQYDPKSPDPSKRTWKLEETVGPRAVSAEIAARLSFFEDWTWEPKNGSSNHRFAARQVYDPFTKRWRVARTRKNW